MAVTPRRTLEQTQDALTKWLSGRLAADEVVVTNVTSPKAGFSNETLICNVSWRERAGGTADRSVVLRVQPTAHQVFMEPDAIRQARVMMALERTTQVPVPHVWLVEPSADALGAPFYLMDRVPGLIPSDEPSWHRRGWVADLAPSDRVRVYESAVTQLAKLHAIDWHNSFEFLGVSGAATALDAYIDGLVEWARWASDDVNEIRSAQETVAEAIAFIDAARPQDPTTGLVWGDARIGNMIFSDDLAAAALVDWEGATIGPPEIDLSWWLLFEENLCEGQGLTRLDGIPDRRGTIALYEKLSGRATQDLEYYDVIAGAGLVLITSTLRRLLVKSGTPPEIAAKYVTRAVKMLRERLDRASV
jgi:aminoglycoside phosphotransferase (APT) family kinase protein